MKRFYGALFLLALVTITYARIASIRRPKQDMPSLLKKAGMCPPAISLTGNCTFDENLNCLTDAKCPEGQKCCREGCNKVCKPILTLPQDFPLPDFGVVNRWKSQKAKEWNVWADETRKVMMERLAGLWEIAVPVNNNTSTSNETNN